MIDIICRKSAIIALKELREDLMCAGDPFLAGIINRAIRCIENVEAPAADVEEVVRCEHCARNKKGYCTIRKDAFGATLLVNPAGYCSDGERRTDG